MHPVDLSVPLGSKILPNLLVVTSGGNLNMMSMALNLTPFKGRNIMLVWSKWYQRVVKR